MRNYWAYTALRSAMVIIIDTDISAITGNIWEWSLSLREAVCLNARIIWHSPIIPSSLIPPISIWGIPTISIYDNNCRVVCFSLPT